MNIFFLQGDNEKLDAGTESKHNRCVFCLQTLVAKDVPKLMECLHVVCNSCITNKVNEIDPGQPALVQCPECDMASQPDKIILDQFLIESTEANADETQSNADPDSKVNIRLS